MSRNQQLLLLGAAVVVLVGFSGVVLPKVDPRIANFSSVELMSGVGRAARKNGPVVKLGEGDVRSYVLYDQTNGAPKEIGVAFSERALDGLPAAGSGHHGAGMMTHEYLVALPEGNGTPFTF